MVIIDADGHAVDFDAVYRERLPAQFRDGWAYFQTDYFDRWQNGTIAWQPKTAEQNGPTSHPRNIANFAESLRRGSEMDRRHDV
jgi:hypothetical protein